MIAAFFSKYLLWLILALVIALGGTAYGWYSTVGSLAVAKAALLDANRATERAVAARKTADKVLASERRRYEGLLASAQAKSTALQGAVAANPEWSQQNVPAEVLDALR